MLSKTMPPTLWCNYDVYDSYIEHFDKTATIDDKIQISLETISDLCKTYKCNPAEIFEHIKPLQILTMVNSRKLSPWVLLQSVKFKDYLKFKTNQEDRIMFNTFIDMSKWKPQFLENPGKVLEIKGINKELGI